MGSCSKMPPPPLSINSTVRRPPNWGRQSQPLLSWSAARSPLSNTREPRASASPQASERVPSMPETPRNPCIGRGGPVGSANDSQSRTGELLASIKGRWAGSRRLSWRTSTGSCRGDGSLVAGAPRPSRAWANSACTFASAWLHLAARARDAGAGAGPGAWGGSPGRQTPQPSPEAASQPTNPASLWPATQARGSKGRGSASETNTCRASRAVSQRSRRRLAGKVPSRSTWAGARPGSARSRTRS